jgi:hypothetical protein
VQVCGLFTSIVLIRECLTVPFMLENGLGYLALFYIMTTDMQRLVFDAAGVLRIVFV